MKREDFAFSSMRVRMAEKKLLTPSIYDRMAEAKDFADALRILRETRYADAMTRAESADVEAILRAEREVQDAKLREWSAGLPIARFAALDAIYHNAKIGIKEVVDGVDLSALKIPQENAEEKEMTDWIHTPRHNPGTSILQKAIAEGLAVYEENRQAQALDRILDRALAADRMALAKAIGTPLFRQYVQEMADFSNVLTVLRAKKQGVTRADCEAALVTGGCVETSALLQAFHADAAAIEKAVKDEHGASSLQWALHRYVEEKDLRHLEQARDERRLAFAQEAEKTLYGPEVLYSYALRVEGELQNLRILLAGKRAGLSARQLRARLRQG